MVVDVVDVVLDVEVLDVEVLEVLVDVDVDGGRVVDVVAVEVVLDEVDDVVLDEVVDVVLDEVDEVPMVVAGVVVPSPPRRASAINTPASSTMATMRTMMMPLRPRSGG